MSDESLDNLFKKGLSDKNVAFNMESWRKMEQMLPAEKKPAGFKWGTTAAIVGGVIVLASSILFWNAMNYSSELPGTANSDQEISLIQEEASANLASNNVESAQEESDLIANSIQNANTNNLDDSFTEEVTPTKEFKEVHEVKASNQEYADSDVSSNTLNQLNENQTIEASSTKEVANENQFFAQNDGFQNMRLVTEETVTDEIEMAPLDLASLETIGGLESVKLENEEHTLFAEIGDSKLPRLKKNEFGFIGGVSFNPSLVAENGSDLSGCEVLGFTYQRYLNGGWSVKSDLLYAPRNEVNAIKSFDRKIYGFGSVSEQTHIESQRLVYLELPVMINYNAGNHNFMGGASASYLVTGQHKVSTEYTNNSESTVEDEMKWGNTDGFKSYDFSVVAGYEYSIKPKWNVGLRLNYGLVDVTNNGYFGTNSFDNNSQLRVYLKYSPFQF